MFLSELFVENFRGFGAEKNGEHLSLSLGPGVNVLVGENDSGKSTIVDAIRLVLSSRAQDIQRLSEDDFHVSGSVRADTLTIRCTFRDLSEAETSRFIEWLTLDGAKPSLHVTIQATRRDETLARGRRRVAVSVRAGLGADGPVLEGDVRDFLQPTYLRPLRDAEAELSAGRGSRLAQILEAHPDFKVQSVDDAQADPPRPPTTLVGIMRKAERDVQGSPLVTNTTKALNKDLGHLSVGEQALSGEMGITRGAELRHVLEKLELWLAPEGRDSLRTRRGLGLNNLLFMAAELLLLGKDPESGLSLLLIEEPEAHLHPQLQMRLMEFLGDRALPLNRKTPATPVRDGATSAPEANSAPESSSPPVQVILTTHSPNLASKADLESVVLVAQRRCYRLSRDTTRLEGADYAFLRRFLDVTKSNLFFARGVVIVEGDAENLLLPTLARKLGRPFTKYGVSVVNVGSRALFRYARVFQRADRQTVPIRVACIADVDIVPAGVNYATSVSAEQEETSTPEKARESKTLRLQARDGEAVRTFVSPFWTLEYDLARCGLAQELFIAVQLARSARSKASSGASLTAAERETIATDARKRFASLAESSNGDKSAVAATVYEPLKRKLVSKAETAEFLADLLEHDHRSPEQFSQALPQYLVDAIAYVTGTSGSFGSGTGTK